MNLRFIDWIWHVRGSVTLASEQSSDAVFDRLDQLFRQTGTTRERTDDTLIFHKRDQAAQDKMSIFDGGVLQVEKSLAGLVLRYHLTSRALLFCFLAPLLFLGIAQFTIFLGRFDKPSTEAAATAKKGTDARKKLASKVTDVPMNPIDKALGAPAPEKPGKDGADKPGGRDKKPSPTPAYVFAGIFAVLYVVGRILEDRLIKALFRKSLLGS